MMFCMDDGAELLYGPASRDEPQTAILHDTSAANDAATKAQIHTTNIAEPAVCRTGLYLSMDWSMSRRPRSYQNRER